MHRSFRRVRADFLVVAVVVGVGLLIPAAASAAPVSLTLRIEGATRTLFEGPVTTDARQVDGHDGTGTHTCDGTNNTAFPTPGPTVGTAMADEADRGALSWEATWSAPYQEFFLNTIDGETPDFSMTSTYWGLYQGGASASTGMCEVRPAAGGEILWAVTTGSEPILHLTGPSTVAAGQSAAFSVSDESAPPPSPIAGATVDGASTNAGGQATLSFASAGTYTVKAIRSGAVRSNALVVCVHAGNDGTCGTVAPNGTSTPAPGQPVASGAPASAAGPQRPLRSPAAGRTSIRPGARFSAGHAPRLLSGTVAEDGGNLRTVELRLQRRQGGRCQFFSVTLGRLRRATCGRGWLFRVGSRPQWSYLLPDSLPVGRYELDVVPYDASGARGVPRTVTFRVAAPAPRRSTPRRRR